MSQLKSLEQLQQEIGEWAKLNFGENVSNDGTCPSYGSPLGPICSILGMMGELGELAQVKVKRLQGRSKLSPGEAAAEQADAVADLMVFACDYASRQGINLLVVLNKVWDKVQQRKKETYEADKAKEKPLVLEQDGHGFGHVVDPRD